MITSPLIPQGQPGRKFPTLSTRMLVFFTSLLLTAFCVQMFVKTEATKEEIAVGTDFPFFDKYIKEGTWWKGMCNKKCKGVAHKCGMAQDTWKEIYKESGASGAVTKQYQALYEKDAPNNDGIFIMPTGDPNTAPADQDAVVAMATAEMNSMFQAIGNRNALILVVINPDHTFMLEANKGKYVLYQSWVNAFTLRYWLGKGWKVKTQGPCWEALPDEVAKEISAARTQYGKLEAFDASVARAIVTMAISQLAVKLVVSVDGKKSLDFSGAISTIPFLGKEAFMQDKNVLETFTISSRGAQVSFGYFLMPEEDAQSGSADGRAE